MAMRFDPVYGWIDDSGGPSFGRGAGAPMSMMGSPAMSVPDQPPPQSGPWNESYANFGPYELGQYFSIPTEDAKGLLRLLNDRANPQDMEMMQRWKDQQLGQGPGNPFGSKTKWEDTERGLEYLGQHPMGSKVDRGGAWGTFSDIMNLTPFTGFGMVNLEQGRFNVPGSGAHVRDLGRSASNIATAEQMRPEVQGAWATPEARMGAMALGTAGRIAAGYGIGSALAGAPEAAGAGGSLGGAQGGIAPGPLTTDPTIGASMGYAPGIQPGPLMTDPGLSGAGQWGLSPEGAFLGGAPMGNVMPEVAGGLSGGTQGALAASALSQLAGMFQPGQGEAPMDPMQRQPMQPGQVAGPNKPQGGGGGASEDTAHKGLAYRFQDRMKGTRESPGLSSLSDIQSNYPYYMGR